MSEIVLGIDLGTTNSVVAVADGAEVRVLVDDGGSRLIPSVVSFHPDSRVLVGVEARERRLVDAANTIYSVKRLIGRPFRAPEVAEAQRRFAFTLKESANGGVLVSIRADTFTLTEISAFVLREVRRIAEQSLGMPCTKAVITVPAAFDELQRSATKAAGRVAGLDVLRIVNEPTAAALAYGVGKSKKERVAVYDFGGGTFDLTLLELENDVFEVLGSSGDSFLGGDDIDAAVSTVLSDAFLAKHRVDPREDDQAFERIRAAAEWLKCSLSVEREATATVEALCTGASGRPIDLVHAMKREELDVLMRPFILRSLEVCERALADASVAAADLDSVILVGGSTRIPLVRTMVRDFFAIDPLTGIDPDLVVAQGAAIHGYAISKKKPEKGLTKVVLKRMAPAAIKEVQDKRAETRAAGPKQVAFAPPTQLEIPKPPPRVALTKAGSKPGIAGVPAIAVGAKPSPKIALGTRQGPEMGVPTLPRPQLRPSTMPPPEAHPIELGDDHGRLTLDDAFGPAIPLPHGSASSASARRPLVNDPLDDLDGAFGAPSIAQDTKALDTAVTRASHHSAALIAPRLPVIHGGPSSSSEGDDDAVLELGDDALEIGDLEEEKPALFDAFATRPPAFDEDGPPSLPEPLGEADFEFGMPEPMEFESLNSGNLTLPERAAPILMDVTPLSLGVETVGGYCQTVIRKNAPIPCEQSRSFTTASDRQTAVTIRVCQGESRLVAENQMLGVVELSGLRASARGGVRIAVTFEIDASGILDVKAVDEDTGESQRTRIRLLGGADDVEIEAMKLRQAELVGAPA